MIDGLKVVADGAIQAHAPLRPTNLRFAVAAPGVLLLQGTEEGGCIHRGALVDI